MLRLLLLFDILQQKENKPNPFLEILNRLSEKSLKRSLTLQEIIKSFGIKSHSLLIAFLSLPFLQPVPLFGLSTPIGAMIAIVAFFQVMKKAPWIPKRWRDKKVSENLLEKILEVAKKYIEKLSRISSKRWGIFFSLKFFLIFNFFVVSILGLFLSLPLPVPFSNSIPAWGIFINSIGQIEEDGILIVISYVIFAIALAFFGGLGMGALAAAGTLFGLS